MIRIQSEKNSLIYKSEVAPEEGWREVALSSTLRWFGGGSFLASASFLSLALMGVQLNTLGNLVIYAQFSLPKSPVVSCDASPPLQQAFLPASWLGISKQSTGLLCRMPYLSVTTGGPGHCKPLFHGFCF